MQNLCEWVQYSLLNSRKWLHVIAQIDTHVKSSCRQISWFHWTVKTSHNSTSSESRGLFNLGCSSAAGESSEIQKHPSFDRGPEQLLGDDQPRTNQLCYLASGLNDCCWAFFRTVDTLNIISIRPNSVICACCNLLLSWIASKMLSVMTLFEQFIFQPLNKEHLIALFKLCSASFLYC